MADINTFPCRGLSIEVSSGDVNNHAYIKYVEAGVNKEFLIETVSLFKSIKQLITTYYKYFKDTESNILNKDIEHKAVYVPEETYPKTYATPAPSIGQKMEQIGINTVLYELQGVRCYDLDDNTFKPPITADAVSTPCTYSPPPFDPEDPNRPPSSISNDDGTITVTPIDFIGALKYSLIELGKTNNNGFFENLPAGKYTVLVESNADALPYIMIVIVEGLSV